MFKEEARVNIKAAVYGVAAKLGMAEALKLLDEIKREFENEQWRGPGNR